MAEESPRPRPRIPKGFRDTFGDVITARRRMIDTIARVYERYGFSPLETPTLEYLDVLGKFLPDADLPEGGVFAFRDEAADWVGLRYDLTAPLSRVVAQYPDLPLPFRRYQIGPVFRQEKPGPGRFREFLQCDFDTVGSASPAADAEACSVLADALEELGIARGDYLVRVNNRKLLNGVLENAGLAAGGDERVLVVLRAIDKLDRVGMDGVVELLGAGRRDPSGDFTPGANLESAQVEVVRRYLDLARDDRARMLAEAAPLVASSAVGEAGLAELAAIDAMLAATGYGADRVAFDPTVVRGLAYYTGPVFEAELTFEVADESGQRQRFGSVAGGGRYDTLVERFLGRVIPATGASIGIDRLAAALAALGSGPVRDVPGVLVLVMERERIAESFALAAEIRRGGIPAEVFMGEGGMRAQLKYADRRRLRLAVIVGEDERARGEVAVKDLGRGRLLATQISDRDEWRRGQPAQVSVARERLLEALAEMLATAP